MKHLAVLLLALPSPAAIEGVVQNGTTGRPQAGVEVTLMKLDQGMMPVGSVRTDASGKFRFEHTIEGQSAHGLLRAVFEGVTYTELITPGMRSGDVKVTVFKASASGVAPEQHVMLFEPSGAEMIVNESFLFRNQSQPPVTYSGGKNGTLQFYLPPEAKGTVQVNVAGAGGVPIRINAEKTADPEIYRVDHPVKPGESRVDLTYVVPYQDGVEFRGRTLYPNVLTRIAAPAGVTLAGDLLQPMGQEPQTKASIFNVGGADFRVRITGEGRLSRGEGGEDQGGGGDRLSVVPAAIYKQFWVVIGFAAAILALGFYGLYSAAQKS